jgi:hypothetical protein
MRELAGCLLEDRIDFPYVRSILHGLRERDDLETVYLHPEISERIKLLGLSLLAFRAPDVWMSGFLQELSMENCLSWSDFSILLEGAVRLSDEHFEQVRHAIVSNPHISRFPEWREALDAEVRPARRFCAEGCRAVDDTSVTGGIVMVGRNRVYLCSKCIDLLSKRFSDPLRASHLDMCTGCENRRDVVSFSCGQICGDCLSAAAEILHR